MEREKFEQEFRDAFKEAEQSPSENVWVNVELELERAEGKKMKRRIFFYQMLAAAAVTFALVVTGAGILFLGESVNTPQIASNVSPQGEDAASAHSAPVEPQANIETELSDPSLKGNAEGSNSRVEPGEGSAASSAPAGRTSTSGNNRAHDGLNARTESGPAALPIENLSPADNRSGARTQNGNTGGVDPASPSAADNGGTGRNPLNSVPPGDKPEGSQDIAASDNIGIAAVQPSQPSSEGNIVSPNTGNHETLAEDAADGDAQNTGERGEITEPDVVELMLAKLKDREKELAEQTLAKDNKKENSGERIWTSVGFAAGGYNGQANAPVQANAFALNSAVEQQAEASGVAYSVNISMGTRITNRLVLQGGLSYLNNSTSYTSNQVVRSENMDFKPATISDLRAAGSSLFNNSTVIPTAPHSVNNSMEFISVPVQAGYIIIDRRFGLQVNAGVATDFFIQNTIDPQGSGIKATTQDRGAESPYRSTNFSGLMGTEFTYRLGNRYRVALNPGLRYPLNSIYKEETGIESTPLTFDVGLRFRYIFR